MRFVHPRHVLPIFILTWLLPATLLAAANPADFPPFSKKEYTPARLDPKEPDIEVEYPGAATAHGIAKGSAAVSILVNTDGTAGDMLVVSCTDHTFGTALLEEARTLKFAPARFRGLPVPARFNLAYSFVPPGKYTAVNAMEAVRIRTDTALAVVFSAVAEGKLDRALEFTNAIVPLLPPDYQSTDGKPVMLFVTFYVDAEGHVRAPNIESAPAPELIAPMIEAVRQWSFKPPLVKGRPVLVFTGRAVGFDPAGK